MPNDNARNESQPSFELGLSVIVPVLNEREVLSQLVTTLDELDAEQVIVVDGGSDDGTCQWLEEHWKSDSKLLIRSKPGRARQMNAGAELATQDMLLFLHADSRLPSGAKQEICSGGASRIHWGRFDIEFDTQQLVMRVIANFINWRSRLSRVSTGDQGLFVHQSLFKGVGGFDPIPLMEDVVISAKLRKLIWPHCSHLKVVTSARRWQQEGVTKTVLKMWWLRLAFYFGVAPDDLAAKYKNVR